MCRLLFLASDRPLPEIPWDPLNPSFHVRRPQAGEGTVETHFSKPHIYYVGSSQMCGCGFAIPDSPIEDTYDQTEYESAVEDLARFVDYLRNVLTPFDTFELYQAWDGALTRRPRRTVDLALRDVDGGTFGADEPLLFRVTRRTV